MSRHALAIAACILLGLALLFVVTVDVNGWHDGLIGWAAALGTLAIATGAALFMAGPRP